MRCWIICRVCWKPNKLHYMHIIVQCWAIYQWIVHRHNNPNLYVM